MRCLVRICLILAVGAAPVLAQLSILPDKVPFPAFVKGKPVPSAMSLTITMTQPAGSPQLEIQLTPSHPWIVVAPLRGKTPLKVSVSVNTTNIAAGDLIGSIQVSSLMAPYVYPPIPVTMSVLNAPAKLLVEPAGPIELKARADNPKPITALLLISTDSTREDFTITSSQTWLTVDPTGGSAAALSRAVANITVNPASLSVGQKLSATLNIASPRTLPATIPVTVNMTLSPGTAGLHSVWPKELNISDTPLLLTLTGVQFYDPATTVTVNKRVLKLIVLSSDVATLLIPADMLSKSGTLTIAMRNTPEDPEAIGTVLVSAPRPFISTVVNSASFELPTFGDRPAVSPGELISIFGSNLGPTKLVKNSILNGEYRPMLKTQVKLTTGKSSKQAIPTFVYESQINALLPFDIIDPVEIVVVSDGQESEPFLLSVRKAAVGIFTSDSTGRGQAAVTNYDSGQWTVNSAQHPTRMDDVISIYATGCGMLDSSGANPGALVDPKKPAPQVLEGIEVRVDNITALVLSQTAVAGMVPGLCQINAQVPAVKTPGIVTLQLKMGDVYSPNQTTIVVR
ncbi:MAG: hypothetical protein H7Y20_06620 [Bryobacteraceae bacterium]|nr:hypothetical protein [Bryobacteraceae bacterium]